MATAFVLTALLGLAAAQPGGGFGQGGQGGFQAFGSGGQGFQGLQQGGDGSYGGQGGLGGPLANLTESQRTAVDAILRNDSLTQSQVETALTSLASASGDSAFETLITGLIANFTALQQEYQTNLTKAAAALTDAVSTICGYQTQTNVTREQIRNQTFTYIQSLDQFVGHVVLQATGGSCLPFGGPGGNGGPGGPGGGFGGRAGRFSTTVSA